MNVNRFFLALLWSALVAALFGTAGAGEGKPVLHLYTWSDYFEPEAVAAFEDDNDCHVVIDYFDSNEAMYAKIKAGAGGYDIITPSSYMSAVMNSQDMLARLDHAKIPNIGNLMRVEGLLTEDPDFVFSLPYTRTVSGIGYNSARIKNPAHTWNIFSRDDLARRLTMLNDMREAIGAALKYLGHSLNTVDDAELEAAGKQLREWKRNLAKFEVDEAKIGLGSGEFLAIHGYNGDVALIMQESDDISFYVPEEGSSVTFDDFVILKESRNIDLAHAFINHFLDPEMAALNMEGICYFMPNAAALAMLPDELRENPAFVVADETMAKCEVIRDLGADNAKYIRIWDMVKAED